MSSVPAVLWLLIPVAATLVAVLVVVLASRPRKPGHPADTVEGYERFRAALDDRRGDGSPR